MEGMKVAYRWPTTLRLHPRPPKLVYLDLLHWVALAKAHTGHPDGAPHKEVLAGCIDAVDRGAALFPISDTIYIEVSKIGQHRQRRDLREVIERVSGFMVVTGRAIVATHEIETMLDQLISPNPRPINTMDYLDWGVARAFGMVGGFKITYTESGDDAMEEARSQFPAGPEAFDRALWEAELDLNRKSLEGPTSEEEPEMRKEGWSTAGSFEIATRRAEQEIEQVARFDADPRWRRGRIRDVVAAREVIVEINDTLSRGLHERGVPLETLFPTPGDASVALDSMPSFDVAVSMKTAYHRDPGHRWTPNDIHDIDALGSTLPYCDIVVTDKAAASHANRTGLAERLHTTVLSRTSDLFQHL